MVSRCYLLSGKKNNELKSAEWATDFLTKAGLKDKDNRLVYSLIMATCHGEKPKDSVHQLVVDVDLSILGTNPVRFHEYEEQVRKEYSWVPGFIYRKKRVAVLEQFLSTPSIYSIALFIDSFEENKPGRIYFSLFNN